MKKNVQFKLEIKPNLDDRPQDLENMTRNLCDDLARLNVESLEVVMEKPPADSKALDGALLGSIMVNVANGDTIGAVADTVRSFAERNKENVISFDMDGEKIEIKGASPKDMKKVIDVWVMRQMQKMSSKND